MAWNDQTASVPGDGGRPDADGVIMPPGHFAPPSAPPAMPPGDGLPAPASVMPQSPLMPPPTVVNPEHIVAGNSQPVSPQPGGVAQSHGQPRPGQPDNRDDIWIDRTRKAIAETQNDPFRQVQLLQHLNRLYLKERFNRDVHTDGRS